ncbi:hypothetical protein H6G93_09190 [Nostoc sp. FACHB-973]|nr:hypothetical protein [Nostoc sp. FACHB-973]
MRKLNITLGQFLSSDSLFDDIADGETIECLDGTAYRDEDEVWYSRVIGLGCTGCKYSSEDNTILNCAVNPLYDGSDDCPYYEEI